MATRSTAEGRARGTVDVDGIALSNPAKAYFPESGLTKVDVARYYASIAPRLLPHVAGRPLSLVRCPDGWSGSCFYQKHADKAVNPAVSRVDVPESGGKTATYMSASTRKALVALVQWGVIEMHPWGSRVPRLDRPDRLVFDFDPDPEVPFADVVVAVDLLRRVLDDAKLAGFLKTTGGKGLHVVLPIRPTLSWDEAKAWTKAVADLLVDTAPDRFTTSAAKAKRAGRIFIDYLRNAEGATAVAPYSVRARSGAPVAMPIAWSELGADVRGSHFNVRNVPEMLATRDDPWAGFFAVRQSITTALRKRFATRAKVSL